MAWRFITQGQLGFQLFTTSETMPQRTHPHDPHISNGMLARALIWITRKRIPIFRRLFTAYLNCDIGGPLPKSTFLPHPFGIVLTSGAELGEDVVIGHQVTIGNRGGVMAAPKIGNRVYIGAGAKILGPVTIGDDAIVGANAVVTKDVPARATVVGANRILKQ
jgi:serine O-acetyltransferase